MVRCLILAGLFSGLIATVTPAAIAEDLPIKLVSAPSTVSSGERATIILQTEPGAICGAEFDFVGAGHYTGFKRGPTTANSDGQVSWQFVLTLTKVSEVSVQAHVTCALGDRKGTLVVSINAHS
jgi:hypothetical protein